jgi:LPXTG-site transpeptidase (sortase) family protein
MTKTTKLLFSLFLVFLISFFFGTRFAPLTKATGSCCAWGQWIDKSDCTASVCGTSEGTINQSKYCTEEVCDYSCPTVKFSWSTKEVDVDGHYDYSNKIIDMAGHWTCPNNYTLYWSNTYNKWRCEKNSSRQDATWAPDTYKCPIGYENNPGHTNCRKWIDDTYKTINHNVNVVYEKSNDPHKCHRPSDDTLRDTYGMDHDTRLDFKDVNSEWKDVMKTNCNQVVKDSANRTVSCNNAPIFACPTQSPSPTPTESEPTETPTECPETYSCGECLNYPNHGSMCSRSMYGYCSEHYECGGGSDNWKCSCSDPTATPTEAEPTPTQGEPTPTPSEDVTPTPTLIEDNTPTPTSASNVGGDNSGGNGNPGAPVCNDTKPGTPSLLSAIWTGSDQVKLIWTHAADPHTSYLIAYGPKEGEYPYGNPNVGNSDNYTVGSLTPGAQYCFYVQAQNNCMPGDRSNAICVNQRPSVGGSDVLGTTDNYNPLVVGIKESYGGEILGEATQLAATAEVGYSQAKLPSGNTLDAGHLISIPAIGVNQNIYLPQKIGDELTVGHHEVLFTTFNGVNFYYGHNATDVFGSLFKLRMGDKITLTKNDKVADYQITKTEFISENDVKAVKTDDSNQIVLMTCSYTIPDHRILVIASPVN